MNDDKHDDKFRPVDTKPAEPPKAKPPEPPKAKPPEPPKAQPSPKAEPKAKPPKTKTPDEWGRAQGRYREVNPLVAQVKSHFDWRHAVADKLHGWSKHAYHYVDLPLEISEADYNAALEAAANYPNVPAHGPAVSPLVKG